MPAFYVLVVLGVVVIWFALNQYFFGVGYFFKNIFKDTKNAINENEEDDIN